MTTLTMMEKFQSNGFAHARAGLFGAMGTLGLFPFVQILLLHGHERGVGSTSRGTRDSCSSHVTSYPRVAILRKRGPKTAPLPDPC